MMPRRNSNKSDHSTHDEGWGFYTETDTSSTASASSHALSNQSKVSQDSVSTVKTITHKPKEIPFPKLPRTISESKCFPGELKRWRDTVDKQHRQSTMHYSPLKTNTQSRGSY